MKKIFVSFIIVCAVGFTVKHDSEKASAIVNQYQGIYIFVDSKPASAFDYLGTVEVKRSKHGPQYEPVKNALLKAIKEKYPNANGAVLQFVNGAADKADAILLR